MKLTEKQVQKLMSTLNTCGLFITCGLNPPNVMSTHWGCYGTMWNKRIFALPVRASKMSHDIIDANKSFAVCVPDKDMRDDIAMCDHLSGFITNKFEQLHLHPKKARSIPSYVLAECGLILECKVLFAADMDRDQVDPALLEDMYSCKDFHTVYFGEIVEVYEL